jgi:hypothetical protein
VAAGVRFAQIAILGRLRNRTVFSLAEANAAIAEAVERIDGHAMKRPGATRRALFEQLERTALRPLPAVGYEYAEWRLARVSLDHHVEAAGFFYCAPHALIREQVDVRLTARTVELFHRGQRVAAHPGMAAFIRPHHSVLITGPCGVGRSWLACALGARACREDFSVANRRMPRLLAALALARGDGRHARLLKTLGWVDLLILDDWGPEQLDADQRRDILEIVEDRHGRRSTIVTSQAPVEAWYDLVGNPTVADAVPDRLVHNARRITLTGESLGKWIRQTLAARPAATPHHTRLGPDARRHRVRLQIGTVSGFKSETASDFRSENPSDFVGISSRWHQTA